MSDDLAWQRWLPPSAVARAVADAPIARIVAEWAAAWFAGAPPRVRDAIEKGPGMRAGGGWSLEGIALMPDEGAEARVIASLFGAPPEPDTLTPADRDALSIVVEACLTDLRTRLAAGFAIGDTAWRPALAGEDAPRCRAWPVEAGREALLEVRVDDERLVRWWCGRFSGGEPKPLTPRVAALAAQPVAVGAMVGRSRVTTADMAGLVPGDVVVLDRAIGTPAWLAVAQVASTTPCAVERDADDRLHLLLVD